MTKIRLDSDDIKHITLFETMTGAKVKDFLHEDDNCCFLVRTGDMGLAIGKKGSKIASIRKALGKNVTVMEYNEDPEQFIKNMLHPVEVHGISIDKTSGNMAAQVEIAREDRSRAIGPGGSKIRLIKTIAKRHCGIDEFVLRTV